MVKKILLIVAVAGIALSGWIYNFTHEGNSSQTPRLEEISTAARPAPLEMSCNGSYNNWNPSNIPGSVVPHCTIVPTGTIVVEREIFDNDSIIEIEAKILGQATLYGIAGSSKNAWTGYSTLEEAAIAACELAMADQHHSFTSGSWNEGYRIVLGSISSTETTSC